MPAPCQLPSYTRVPHIHAGTTAGGKLGGAKIGPTDFVITAFGNTEDRRPFNSGFSGWSIDHMSASIALDGIGTFGFLGGTRTFVNNESEFQIVGFSRQREFLDLFNGPRDPAFVRWDMLSSIGPMTGEGDILQWTGRPDHQGSGMFTSGGFLQLKDNAAPVTFTATVIPLPATGLLLLSALALSIFVRRRV